MGSEGSLGIITQSWVRLQRKPRFRSSVTGRFNDLESAANAIRAVAQAGLWPSNCRLVDAEETKLAGAGDGSFHLILLGFESSYQPVDHWMDKAIKCAEEFGGDFSAPLERNKTADAWRDAFITAPFKREGLISCGIMHDTFETAITWDRLPRFHKNVKAATEEAIIHTTGHRGHVSCRFTHAYPDGTAPYFTFHAKAIPGHELEHWKAIKEAVSDSLIKEGGTITHHHAIGRDHMPWYLAQRPEIFGEALKSIKTRLDPSGILNPGVIVPIKEKV
jgi:alkyldihydroxyacetonephosphate synthase